MLYCSRSTLLFNIIVRAIIVPDDLLNIVTRETLETIFLFFSLLKTLCSVCSRTSNALHAITGIRDV